MSAYANFHVDISKYLEKMVRETIRWHEAKVIQPLIHLLSGFDQRS